MSDNDLRLRRELGRLTGSGQEGPKPLGIGRVTITATCPGNGPQVVERATSLLALVDEATLAGWPQEGEGPDLPSWFTEACAPAMSQQEADAWLEWWQGLPKEEQEKAELEKQWEAEDWLYWMEPAQRAWFWWDAQVSDDGNHVEVRIEVDAWPFPWGALRWLLRSAGASECHSD